MSRSVTIVIAYIMSITDLTWKEALKVIKASRSIANPNIGFQKQLQDFETYFVHEVFVLYTRCKISIQKISEKSRKIKLFNLSDLVKSMNNICREVN